MQGIAQGLFFFWCQYEQLHEVVAVGGAPVGGEKLTVLPPQLGELASADMWTGA